MIALTTWLIAVYIIRSINADGFRIVFLDQVDYGLRIVLAIWGAGAGLLLLVKRWLPLHALFLLGFLGLVFVRDVMLGHYESWSVIAGSIIVITLLARQLAGEDILRIWLSYVYVFVALGVLLALVWPERGWRLDGSFGYLSFLGSAQLDGIAMDPNAFGALVSAGVLILASTLRFTWDTWVMLFSLTVLLLLSGSDGSMIALLGGVFFIIVMKDFWLPRATRYPWKTIALSAIGALVAAQTAIIIATSGFDGFTTGRTKIWRSFLASALEAGFFGLGSGHGYSDPDVFDSTAQSVRNPHNNLLTVQLFTGFVGLSLFIGFWVFVVIAVLKSTSTRMRLLGGSLAIFLFTSGLVESHFLPEGETAFALYGLLVAALASSSGRDRATARDQMTNPQ